MTWTYDPTQIAANPVYQVRRLIGDVITSDQQIADEEIAFALTQRSSIYGAAADCCRYISAQYSRKTNVVTTSPGGSLTQNFSQQANAYAAKAAALDNMSVARGGALPYAGGTSVADKESQESDPDRVAPSFNIGMDENDLPVGPVGNENASDAEGLTAPP
jgi:hypothetical protein